MPHHCHCHPEAEPEAKKHEEEHSCCGHHHNHESSHAKIESLKEAIRELGFKVESTENGDIKISE